MVEVRELACPAVEPVQPPAGHHPERPPPVFVCTPNRTGTQTGGPGRVVAVVGKPVTNGIIAVKPRIEGAYPVQALPVLIKRLNTVG